MPVLISDIKNKIYRKMADFGVYKKDTFTADGVERIFKLQNKYVTNVVVVVNGITKIVTTHYTVDANRGYVTFTPAGLPTSEASVEISYYYWYWSDDLIDDILNEAVEVVSKYFATRVVDSSLSGDGETREFAVPSGIRRVTRIRTEDSSGNILTKKMWQVDKRDTGDYIEFRSSAPSSGDTIYVHGLADIAVIAADDDALEDDIGLPEKTAELIATWAAAQLFEQRLIPRMRDNKTYNSEQEHAAKIYELQREADRLHLNWQRKLMEYQKEPEVFS